MSGYGNVTQGEEKAAAKLYTVGRRPGIVLFGSVLRGH